MLLDLQIRLEVEPAPSVDDVTRDTLEIAGAEAERRIEARWPVDTGRSRRAWTLRPTADGFELSNSTPYAAYVKGGASIVDRVLEDVAEETAERLAETLPPSILAEVS